jgi:hypothetical protein
MARAKPLTYFRYEVGGHDARSGLVKLRVMHVTDTGDLYFGGNIPGIQTVLVPEAHAIAIADAKEGVNQLKVPFGTYAAQLQDFHQVALLELAALDSRFVRLNSEPTEDQENEEDFDERDWPASMTAIYSAGLVWQCASECAMTLTAVRETVYRVLQLYPQLKALFGKLSKNDEMVTDEQYEAREGDVFCLEFNYDFQIRQRILVEFEECYPHVLQYLDDDDGDEGEEAEGDEEEDEGNGE